MSKIKFHKVAAVAVLVVTAAWVATGEFSSVGSAADEAQAERKAEAQQERAATLRTVGVVAPPRIQHARAIRISGHTDADKRAALATRGAGIIEELPVKLGSEVKRGDVIVKLEAEGREAALASAQQVLAQREAEAKATRLLAERGSIPKLQLDNVLSALAAARSQVEQAQVDLDRNILRAPFDGVIDKVDVEIGSA